MGFRVITGPFLFGEKMSSLQRLACLETLENFVNEELFMPSVRWPTYEFDKRSYERWAAEEAIHRIMYSKLDPIDVLQNFLNQLHNYELESDDPGVRMIFETAYNTVEQMGALLV